MISDNNSLEDSIYEAANRNGQFRKASLGADKSQMKGSVHCTTHRPAGSNKTRATNRTPKRKRNK